MAQQFHTLICLNIIFLPLIDLTLLMWFYNYYSFKLSHKNDTVFSLKPLFNLCLFLGGGESSSTLSSSTSSISSPSGMFIYQSSLSLVSHSSSVSPLWHMFLLIQIPMILKCIPYITWLEFLRDPEQFLVRLLSIDKYLISFTEPIPCLYWIKLTMKLLKQLLHEVCPQWAELVVCDC